jgi:hypothetical protein
MNAPHAMPVQSLTVETTMPIFWADLSHVPGPLALAREAIDDLRVSHPESTPSNVKSVYMSPWKSHQLSDKFKPLCDIASEMCRQAALAHLNTDLQKLNWGLAVTDCWGAIYEDSDHTIAHSHFPSDFAAVTYLEADENAAPIIFANKLVVKPRPNMIIMFPGMLLHSVPENHGRRVVVAMNLHKFPRFAPAEAAVDPAVQPQQAAPVPELLPTGA